MTRPYSVRGMNCFGAYARLPCGRHVTPFRSVRGMRLPFGRHELLRRLRALTLPLRHVTPLLRKGHTLRHDPPLRSKGHELLRHDPRLPCGRHELLRHDARLPFRFGMTHPYSVRGMRFGMNCFRAYPSASA
jgi:hypothetical protein